MARNKPDLPPDAFDALAEVAERYDTKVRLLFQLRNYISLVKYDPVVAKKDRTSEFRSFVTRGGFDIWKQLDDLADTRKSKKHLQAVQRDVDLRQKSLRQQYAADLARSKSAQQERSTSKRTTKLAPVKQGAAKKSTAVRKTSKRPAAEVDDETADPWDIDSDLGIPGEMDLNGFNSRRPKRARRGHHRAPPQPEERPQLIMNPWHFVKPSFGGSLDAFLNSYRTITDDNEPISDEQWAKRVEQDAVSVRRVHEARVSGKLAELEANGVGSSSQIPKFVDPTPADPSYHENLLVHTIHYAKQKANLRKFHQSIIKRNTQSVEQYFRRLAGAEDRERKELDRQLRQIARRMGQEVMRKWKLAEKIVEQRRQAVLDEEKREKGKEYLNQILDNSAKLIESRIGDLEQDGDEDGTDLEEDEDLEDEDLEEDSSDGEDRFASIQTDSNKDGLNDAQLSLEELRKKYADLPDISLSASDSDDESNASSGEESSNEDINENEQASTNESENESENQSSEDSEAEKPSEDALKLYAEAEQNGEEEEEEDSSDLSSDESEDSSSEDSESEDNRPTLASLLSGTFNASESDEDVVEDDVKTSESESEAGDGSDENIKEEETGAETKVDQTESAVESDEHENGVEDDEITDVTCSEQKEEAMTVVNGHSSNGHATNGDANSTAMEVDLESIKEDNDVKMDSGAESSFESEVNDDAKKEVSRHKIDTPFLLRGTLREYQRNGLDWLAGLVQSGTNGILADEMGLGKTIQTIALLSWLACEKHIWGPHLIIVPTSVMLNWEMEFKRFAPGLKILTYFGTPQQRKRKRRGWNKEDTWHVCITSYQLVIQDQVVFRGKRWQFMVLDEAHNIKNFRSQRWQALLNFNAQHRLLLTGTPLQNNLVELWSLLYFLMPSTRATHMMPAGFASLDDFQEWFAKPVDQMVEEGEEADDEARATISKLHQVLRPYLLRRLKADVEKQMPGKYEHVIYSRLSKRQRYLYDDFMSRASTQSTLASGNFMSILNCLMQLRKVCNHPNLFEVRPIVTSYVVDSGVYAQFSQSTVPMFDFLLHKNELQALQLDEQNLVLSGMERELGVVGQTRKLLSASSDIRDHLALLEKEFEETDDSVDLSTVKGWSQHALFVRRKNRVERTREILRLNERRTSRVPLYGKDLLNKLRIVTRPHKGVLTLNEREERMQPILERYAFVTPGVVVLDYPKTMLGPALSSRVYSSDPELALIRSNKLFHEPQVRLSIAFPDKRLLQYDCGKLQTLAVLLHDLISHGHRVLIFTQMTRVLDILEQFLNLHGWRYLRLDGATRIEQRQALTERFNKDANIPVFILSTRSGGLGINLTGADTVVFYDSDWNPAMDKQCQDRCHRIGQTRDVHIYRLVSEFTIESNILRKATQKTILDNVVIQEGEFTTEYFTKMSVRELLGNDAGRGGIDSPSLENLESGNKKQFEAAMAQAEDRDDQVAANLAMSEARMDQEEFADTKQNTSGGTTPASVRTPEPEGVSEVSRMGTPESVMPTESSPGATESSSRAPESSSQAPESPDGDTAEQDGHMEIGHIDDWMIKVIERGDLQ